MNWTRFLWYYIWPDEYDLPAAIVCLVLSIVLGISLPVVNPPQPIEFFLPSFALPIMALGFAAHAAVVLRGDKQFLALLLTAVLVLLVGHQLLGVGELIRAIARP